MLKRLILVGWTLAALLALLPATAMATHVSCGDVITQDTTLDSDLVNCPGDGVVIGASGVTLDLGGHLIDGTAAEFNSTVGVDNRAGHDGVTITNGRFTDFFFAVDMRSSAGGAITRLDTPRDLNLQDSPDILIENNATGFINIFGSSHRVLVARNDITGRIFVQGGYSPTPPLCCPQAPTGSPEGLIIDRNTITTSFGQGIYQSSAPLATITRNRVIATGTSEFAVGIAVGGRLSHATVVERNTVSGTLVGIDYRGPRSGTVARNTVSDNAEDGIRVLDAPDVLIDGNTTLRNGDDGIDVDSGTAVIRNNTANFNGDLGIEAVPGVTDGGGNRARGNGNPTQCLNVSCK